MVNAVSAAPGRVLVGMNELWNGQCTQNLASFKNESSSGPRGSIPLLPLFTGFSGSGLQLSVGRTDAPKCKILKQDFFIQLPPNPGNA